MKLHSLSAKAALTAAAMIVATAKRKIAKLPDEERPNMRELTLDMLDDIYYDGCTVAAQEHFRGRCVGSEQTGAAAFRRLAGW